MNKINHSQFEIMCLGFIIIGLLFIFFGLLVAIPDGWASRGLVLTTAGGFLLLAGFLSLKDNIDLK